ncbi:Unknown protein [Striga hermonthica]|uniref:DUF4283 domain-containing protein n=1 Tax=Striga hermonthica TaxID=68872 RepID=A0A9N7RRV6_STRHE|nr:Unknown protein [Striga hermonthica]
MERKIVEKFNKFDLLEKEQKGITLSEADVELGVQECALSIIGRIVGEKKVSVGGLKTTMGVAWRTSRPFSIRVLGQNEYQFLFQSREDKEKVLKRKTWNFDGQYMILKDWKKGETEFKEEEIKVELWVQIHKLPLHWISMETGMRVGQFFGKVKDVVVPLAGSVNGRVIKILVDRNVVKSGQFGEWLRGSNGESWEGRERRTVSPHSPKDTSGTNKGISGEGEDLSPTRVGGDKESRGRKHPTAGETIEADDDIIMSAELVKEPASREQGGSISGEEQIQGYEIIPMVCEGKGKEVLEPCNLVEVAVQQEVYNKKQARNQRSFIRITRGKDRVGIQRKAVGESSGNVGEGEEKGYKRKYGDENGESDNQNIEEIKKQKVGKDMRGNKRFYFDGRWVKTEGYLECVREGWGRAAFGHGMYKFQQKLRNVRGVLIGWANQQISNSAKEIKECNERLEIMGKQGGFRNWEEWFECKKKVQEAYKKEELFWKQKARVRWLREGDRNTKYFQACVRQRRSVNSLENLERISGGRCETEGQSQGVGVQSVVPSAMDNVSETEELRGVAWTGNSLSSKWMWQQGRKQKISVERELLEVREWLLQGLQEGWGIVKVMVQNKQLANICVLWKENGCYHLQPCVYHIL